MNPSQTNSNKPTYASKVNTTFASKPKQETPKKEQAIIMNAYNDFELIDYLKAIGNLVGPKNIHFASKISNNRICIFLANKNLVDQIVHDHPKITINDQQIQLRRLITPAIRITLSNVYPFIPEEVLENALKAKGLKLVSPINYLRAGEKHEDYAHTLSFRRQVYIEPDSNNIHDSLEVTYEETIYRIYLSGENIICFKCKTTGHPASKCPKETINLSTINTTQPSTSNSTKRSAPMDDTIEIENEPENFQKINDNYAAQPPINQQHETNINNLTQTEQPIKKIKKPARKTSPAGGPSVETLLDPIKKEMEENPTNYILSYDKLKDFIENVQGSSDQISTAQEYTENIEGLVETLNTLYSLLTHSTIKNRFTRLLTKLRAHIQNNSNSKNDASMEL